MTPAVLCHETNFKTLRRTVARLYKDGAAVVLCCFEDGCNASVERVKDSLRRVNSAPSDPDNQIQIINIGGSSNIGGGSKVGTSDVLAQLQQVNNTDTNATKSFINEKAKSEIKEDTKRQIKEDTKSQIKEDTKSQIEDDAKSSNEIADSTQLQDTKSSFDVRESKHVLDPTNEAGYDDLFLDKKELPQSVVARRSNFEVK